MAIVTGDRYLEQLVDFVERNAGALLDGTLTLKLNPAGLRYVQSRLEALRELEGLLAGAPVDYLRAYVSDLGDHRALEQLRRILRLLTSLKVISPLPAPARRDPTPLALGPFGRLRVLELRGCDLSTSAAKGLLELRHTLEKLICHNSTDALRHVFASRIVDVKDSPVWNRLSFVSCACNGLVLMDESLQLLPAVETLDLSRNRFTKVDNLRKCMKLRHLDLGFNHLRKISLLSEASSRIVKLVLRNNALTTLHGIENLKSLEGLDLSYNIISSFVELEILANLSRLQSLWLEGNPICYARWYRAHVFSFFPHPEKLKLDEKGISTGEYWERHVIISASKQKHPSGYGFYFPAKDGPTDETNLSTKRKKSSRLACIDEEQRNLCEEALDQEIISSDSDHLRKEENAITESESKIVGLISRAEYLKKERSNLWLREFKEWMDQTSDDAMDKAQCVETKLGHGKGRNLKHKKVQKLFRETSKSILDPTRTSNSGSSSNMLESESELSFSDAKVGGASLELVISEADQSLVHQNETQNLSSSELGYPRHSSFTADKGDAQSSKTNLANSAASNVINEIMVSQLSNRYPRSPPKYREDILQHRLYLEEEFLQLSAESHDVRLASGSDTSSSDEALCQLNSSSSEDEYGVKETFMKLGVNGHSTSLPDEDEHSTQMHEKGSLVGDNITLNKSAEQDSGLTRNILANNVKGVVVHVSSDGVDSDTDQMGQEVGSMARRKGKRKFRRRVIPLCDYYNGTKLDVLKANGILQVYNDDTQDVHGQASCYMNISQLSCKEFSTGNQEGIITLTNGSKNTLLDPKAELDQYLKDIFNQKVADQKDSETCEDVVYCECIIQQGTNLLESKVSLLRSCTKKLYVLLVDETLDGQEVTPRVLESCRLEELAKVAVGLGLQALRVYMIGDASYLFLARSVEKAKAILNLLQDNSMQLNNRFYLQSWEQVQVKLLEKHICGSLKMGIFLYSMLLFWCDDCKGETWEHRSLFVIDGSIVVCVENLVQFGSSIDDLESSLPYFSLDSCCPIESLLEMAIDLRDMKCSTLILDVDRTSRNIRFLAITHKNRREVETSKKIRTWKLKWFSERLCLSLLPW
ncbi:Serine/threonine-protein kinase 11-interacting protein [Ananas comosus]|uniref:Serine/threonine-protein kinase 11-interacting protein n=1 Tax=Ananas comosus TaxID=4615 RepID=A0A199W3U2_ANACO|nr:Serine/threonine-protein kinase 11-interacting protein [Ananas comosus]